MKVLFITCIFPPTGGTGVMRAVALTKYLSEFGWEPFVLTVAKPRKPYDYSLLKEIHGKFDIFRAGAIVPPNSNLSNQKNLDKKNNLKFFILQLYRKLKNLFISDVLLGWIYSSVKMGVNIHKKNNIDLIFVTGPPNSSYITGYLLKKILGIPLIIDFRDAWVPGDAQQRYNNSKPKYGDKFLERRIVYSSDRIITVTNMITQMMQKRYPYKKNKFRTITNGFDSKHFQEYKNNHKNMKKMIMTYVGFFPDKQTAKYFLKAVEILVLQKTEVAKSINISFVGGMKPQELEMLTREPLCNIAEFTERVPYDDALKRMYNSDILLLFVYTGPGVLTTKFFEYIAVGRPILALVPPEGEAAQLIKDNDFGVVVPPTDVDAIKNAINDLYLQWRDGKLKKSNDPEKIKVFDRKYLTGRLAEVFNEVCEEYGRR